jgi:hypothetical protein
MDSKEDGVEAKGRVKSAGTGEERGGVAISSLFTTPLARAYASTSSTVPLL